MKKTFTGEDALAAVQPIFDSLTPNEQRVQLEAERAHRTRMALAIAIHRARSEAGITQNQLSDLSGVPQQEISRLEKAKGNPTVLTLTKIGSVLNLQLGYAPDTLPQVN